MNLIDLRKHLQELCQEARSRHPAPIVGLNREEALILIESYEPVSKNVELSDETFKTVFQIGMECDFVYVGEEKLP